MMPVVQCILRNTSSHFKEWDIVIQTSASLCRDIATWFVGRILTPH